MIIKRLLTVCLLLFIFSAAVGQDIRGRIKTAATPATNPMDPNGDGWTTNPLIVGGRAKPFSAYDPTKNYTGEFELKMWGFPKIGNGDITGDNFTGPSCGLSDVIPDTEGYSVYAHLDESDRDGNGQPDNNLIIRFRLGADASSIQSWQVLVDTDNKFGVGTDPNGIAGNPGFELNFSLVRKNNPGIFVTVIDGISSCPNPILTYPLGTHFQSVEADLLTCGDPDVFYDFYIPLDDVFARTGLSKGTRLRFAASTSQSPSCAFSGSFADISGVDNTDPQYSDAFASFAALTETQCPTSFGNLCETCTGFSSGPNAPEIDEPIRGGQTAITGKAEPNVFVKVEVFPRIGGTDQNPVWDTTPSQTLPLVQAGTDSVWSATLISSLVGYEQIVASTQFTTTGNACQASETSVSTSVTVVDPNVAPVAINQTITIDEDNPGTLIVLGATDADNDLLTFTRAAPSNGTLTGTGANVTYKPNANFFGTDSFTFQASDGTLLSNVATVTINVTSVNDAPVANNQSVSTTEDTQKSITLTATDVESDPLTWTVLAGPSHGTLSGTAPNLEYTPNSNYNGPDSFTFKVNDGSADSNTATVSITVTAVNDAPVANNQSVTTNEDTAASFVLTATDVDLDALTYIVVTNPTNGTLSGTAPNLTYTPNANFNGSDSFTFQASDGAASSNTATVTITVTAVNDPPIANNQSVTTTEDSPASITLTGSDIDGNTLTYTVVTQPENGTLSGIAPNLTYTPDADFNGFDSFTFKVNDGTVDSNTATVSITVTPVNDAPEADDKSVVTDEDASVQINLTASDKDGDVLTWTILSQPLNGTLTGTAPDLTYTPAENFNGSDSFTFKVNDGSIDSNTATVSITVTSVNDSPIAGDQTVTTAEDTAKDITLTALDVDQDNLTWTIVDQPANGTLSGTAPDLTYTPDADFTGLDSFTFKVNDGSVDSNTATVNINISPVNDAPVADDQSVTTNEDTSKGITLTASDVEGNALTFSLVSQPSHGTLSGTAPNLTYTPAENYNGPDSFTFKVNDGTDDSNTATVSITVNAVNDAPVANAQSVTTAEDTAVSITLTATDVDGDGLTYSVLTQPTRGVLSGTAPNLTYTPNANANGSDSFTFRVNDGTANSNTATVSITITPVNDAPVADNQSVTTNEDVAVSINLTGTDVEGSALTYTVVSQPTSGTLTGTAPNLTYTPNLNFNGSDSFTFKVNDGTLDSNNATVSITVTAVNDAPVAFNRTVAYDPYNSQQTPTSVNFTLLATDVEGNSLTYTLIGADPIIGGTITGTAPDLTFAPDVNFLGTTTFTFTVSDGSLTSNTATVTLLPSQDQLPPVTENAEFTTEEDTNITFTLPASDANGDNLTYTIRTTPSSGILEGTPSGTLVGIGAQVTYKPAANFNGQVTFLFIANDGFADSNESTITINVTPVNDVPVAAAQSVSVIEDTPKAITLTATDIETTVLNYTVVTQPSNGILSGTAPNLTYTPNPDYNGPDSFTFKANDGTVDSNTATVSINVTPVNDAPVADGQSVTTDEDTPLVIIVTATDTEGSPLTWSVVTAPANGTLSGTLPNITYLPGANFNGSDSFTFKVNDGTVDSNTATVSITVNPVNDVPVANSQSVTIEEDTFADITLTASDVETSVGDLIWTIVTQPSNGILSGTAPNVRFTPTANFNGSASFTFRVNDGTANSNTATVTITVTPVNDAPVASGQTVFTNEDTATPLLLSATDRDGDPLTYAIVTAPSNGTLSCNNCRNPVYTPNLNYNGSDSFTFRANDGFVNSNTATVNISVAPVNDAPIAQNQNVTVTEDTPKEITLTATDVDNDALTYTVLTNPANGTLSGTDANLTYTPNPDFFGSDQFTFRANDGNNAANSNSNIATISITVISVNDLPVANDDVITTAEDTPVTFSITSNDTDKDGSIDAATVDLNPATGSEEKSFTVSGEGTYAVNASGEVTFTPVLNYNGTATPVAYTVRDNQGGLSNQALIKVTVTPVNDNPVIAVQIVITNEDEPKEVCFTYTDVEGSPVEFSYEGSDPVVFTPGQTICFTFTPELNFNGQEQIVISVCETDNTDVCGTAVFPVTVNADNDIPVVIVDNQPVDKLIKTTLEDTQLDFCFDVADVENDNITISGITNVSGGGTLTEGVNQEGERCLSFEPALNFFGLSKWTLQLCDDGSPSRCSTLTIEINVTEVNDLPVAENISITVPEDGQKTFTLAGTDADNDPLTFQILTQPQHGKIVVTGGTVVYTPNFNYFGPDSFNYRVNDGRDDSNTATVSITVTPVNDPPLIQQIPITLIAEDTEGTICVGVIELDGEDLIYQLPTNVSGGGTITQDAEFPFCYNFISAPNFNGDTFWKFKVCDTSGLCSEVVFQIVVTPVNDAPIANDDELVVRSFEQSDIINVLANDTDIENDQLIVTVAPVTAPTHGIVILSSGGGLQYKSELGYIGLDQITYEVCDTGNPKLCATATVNITVTPPQFRIFEGLSPNNDGLNDYWRLNGIEDYPTNRVRVFDRYNNLVYDIRNYDNESNNWRGQANVGVVNGNLPDGTYFYIVEINDGKGPYSGFVVLKRN